MKKQAFVYHGVPENFEGNELIPLLSLKNIYPDLYNSQVKKYDDHPQRKNLPYKVIPILNCKRGEVLHCSSIHPHLVFKALKSVFPEGNRSIKFFKIPVDSLIGVESCLFDVNHPDYKFGLEVDPDTPFKLVDPEIYEEIDVVPTEAIQFYQEWKNRGERGAPAWGKIPHFFIQGNVCVEGLEIIDWRDPI